MTHELIINGQAADIDGVDITLEYVSSLFGDIGGIKFSRSYTIKLPRTRRNAQILGFPGSPAHDPEIARRYFAASYIRNGVDLLGEARAYLLGVTPEAYEIALIWNAMPALMDWKNAKLKLTDIKGLPDVEWPGTLADKSQDTYFTPVFYASYTSGLLSGPELKTAPHPCVTLAELLTRILTDAGVPFTIEQSFDTELMNTVLLVAPSHKPSLLQEVESGSQTDTLRWKSSKWWFSGWTNGWDAPYDSADESSSLMKKGSAEAFRILLNLKITNASPDLYLTVSHGANEIRLYPQTADGGYYIDEVIEASSLGIEEDFEYFMISVDGLVDNGSYTFAKMDDSLPLFAVMRVHDTLDSDHHNTFPVSDNLPDIGQHDFLKAVLAMFGGIAFVSEGTLHFEKYSHFLGVSGSADWTDKVDMSKGDGLENVAYAKEGLAQTNSIRFTDDVVLSFDPTIDIKVEDATITGSRDLIKLPFAASEGGSAVHYKVTGESTDEGYVYTVEDIDIKPRVFRIAHDSDGIRYLNFPAGMYGDGAKAAYYSDYQEMIRKPVIVTAAIRLNELDLAALDFSRPVYLGQYGRYYYILKVQTSDTDLCKVELIQIP